jgi:hypothetical protein
MLNWSFFYAFPTLIFVSRVHRVIGSTGASADKSAAYQQDYA